MRTKTAQGKRKPEIKPIVRPEGTGRTAEQVFGENVKSQPHNTYIKGMGALMEGERKGRKKEEFGYFYVN